MRSLLAVTMLHGAALERAFNVEEDRHDGVGVAHEPGGGSVGSVVDAHVLPGQPQGLEAVDGLVVLPPLWAPGPPSVGQGPFIDDSEEVFHVEVQPGVEQGWGLRFFEDIVSLVIQFWSVCEDLAGLDVDVLLVVEGVGVIELVHACALSVRARRQRGPSQSSLGVPDLADGGIGRGLAHGGPPRGGWSKVDGFADAGQASDASHQGSLSVVNGSA